MHVIPWNTRFLERFATGDHFLHLYTGIIKYAAGKGWMF